MPIKYLVLPKVFLHTYMLYDTAWWADRIFPGMLFFFILLYSCRIKSQTQDILCRVGPKNMLKKPFPVKKNYMLLITCIRLISGT